MQVTETLPAVVCILPFKDTFIFFNRLKVTKIQ